MRFEVSTNALSLTVTPFDIVSTEVDCFFLRNTVVNVSLIQTQECHFFICKTNVLNITTNPYRLLLSRTQIGF